MRSPSQKAAPRHRISSGGTIAEQVVVDRAAGRKTALANENASHDAGQHEDDAPGTVGRTRSRRSRREDRPAPQEDHHRGAQERVLQRAAQRQGIHARADGP